MAIIIRLESGVWLRDGDGDPCRTLAKENATQYPNREVAAVALLAARKCRPFPGAEFQTIEAGGDDDT